MALFIAKPPAVKPVQEKPKPVQAAQPAPPPAAPGRSLVSRLRTLSNNAPSEPDAIAPEPAPRSSARPSAPSSVADSSIAERPSRRRKPGASIDDALSEVKHQATQRQLGESGAKAQPKAEEGPYPSQSGFGPEEWAALDDGAHHVFEVRTADGKHASLARLPHEKLGKEDMIGLLFDRTIIVIGTTRVVTPPPGYKAIRVEMRSLGGDASVLFPEDRPFLKELSTRAPMVIRTFGAAPEKKKTSMPSMG